MTWPYLVAWLTVAVMTLLGAFAFLRATRGLPLAGLWRALALLVAAWMLVPAPVPDFPGHYAPAFFVFLFEAVFQRSGEPRVAGLILAAATVGAAVLILVSALLRRRARVRATS